MKLKLQKRLAAQVLNRSPKRVIFDPAQLSAIKEGITKGDIRSLIRSHAIHAVQKKGISRFHAKERQKQRKKGRQRGSAAKQGTKNARASRKKDWINRIRLQRSFLSRLKEKGTMAKPVYRELYLKSKGGFFRSLRHLKIYMEEHKLFGASQEQTAEKK